MAQTLTELLVRVNELISDPKNQKFTEVAKKRALNTCLQDLISSRLLSYVRSTDIQLRDGEYVYDFPEDMIEPVAIMVQDLNGQAIISTSWRSLVGNLEFDSTAPFNSEVFWQQTGNNGGKMMLRDIVPDNQFIYTPQYDADNETSGTVLRQATLPTSASEGDMWVDTYDDENYVYQASEDISVTSDQAVLTVPMESRPSGTAADLVFTADATGISNIQIVIESTGGAAAVATTGSGTRADPYVVTFSLPTGDSSNDTVISLASGTGIVTATGSDATDGAFTPLAATRLENPSEEKWTPMYIHVRYAAIYSKLVNGSDELDLSIPVIIREGDCIPLMAAAKLLTMVRGDQRIYAMITQYKNQYEDIIERVRYHRSLTTAPHDLEPV